MMKKYFIIILFVFFFIGCTKTNFIILEVHPTSIYLENEDVIIKESYIIIERDGVKYKHICNTQGLSSGMDIKLNINNLEEIK